MAYERHLYERKFVCGDHSRPFSRIRLSFSSFIQSVCACEACSLMRDELIHVCLVLSRLRHGAESALTGMPDLCQLMNASRRQIRPDAGARTRSLPAYRPRPAGHQPRPPWSASLGRAQTNLLDNLKS